MIGYCLPRIVTGLFAAWLTTSTLACSGSVVDAPPPSNAADSATPDDAQKEAPVDAMWDGHQEAKPDTPNEDADTGIDGPAAADGDATTEDGPPVLDIYDGLKAIAGMLVFEESSAVPGCRFFRLTYDQPSNHLNPTGQPFGQRMALIFCSPAAPTILGSTGYMMYAEADPWELTYMFGANQLVVEHRFFAPSVPEPPNWGDLTIQQAAEDHHRIVAAIRPLTTGKWISTGASKGGMASVYHRRFYPKDVDGTVAYVAPQSHGIDDPRYPLFLEKVGDAACRESLKSFQREALLRRPAMLSRMDAYAQQSGNTYQLLGMPTAFEHAVTELWFYFWQYFDASQCANIPSSTASDDEIFLFLNTISPLESVADTSVQYFSPYYYQAATQLGAPKQADAHFVDLLQFPGTDVPATYAPKGAAVSFDPLAMQDVEQWLTTEGETMMFIYGENDPWSAAPFDPSGAKDSFRFWAPAGNHTSQIQSLSDPDRAEALAALQKWTGVKPKPIPPFPTLFKKHPFLRPPL